MGDHAACQTPIGRDQSDALFRRFQCLAHQDGDGLRLLARMLAFHQADGGQAPLPFRQIDPARRSLGGQEQVRDRLAAFGRGRRRPGAMPQVKLPRATPMRLSSSLR
jgi:hypothetical protein